MSDRLGHAAIIVHGGAGNIPAEERAGHLEGLERALAAGWSLLAAGAPALDAVEAAVRVLEDDPTFNAGVGSALRLDGSVAMDASIMDGTSRQAGAVACVSRVRYPVSLARCVMERTPHVLLVGVGAEALAREAGLEMCEPERFVTPREEERLRQIRARQGLDGMKGTQGTVGAVARDREGHVAAATSTGGSSGCFPWRVGDSPIVGAGTMADDRWGGVSCTGLGENMMRTCLAREVLRRLSEGVTAGEAARWATEYLREETGGTCGLICVDARGEVGAAYSTLWMGSRWRGEAGNGSD